MTARQLIKALEKVGPEFMDKDVCVTLDEETIETIDGAVFAKLDIENVYCETEQRGPCGSRIPAYVSLETERD